MRKIFVDWSGLREAQWRQHAEEEGGQFDKRKKKQNHIELGTFADRVLFSNSCGPSSLPSSVMPT